MYGPGSSARANRRPAAQLGDALEEQVDRGEHERRRLRGAPALERVEPAHRLRRGGATPRARRRCLSADTGSPARSAATARSTDVAHGRPFDHPVAAGQVGVARTSAKPSCREQRRDARRLPVADLEHERAAGRERTPRPRARRPRSRPCRRAPRAAPSRAPPAGARRARPARRTAGSRRRGPTAPPGGPSKRSCCASSTVEAGAGQRSRARARARRRGVDAGDARARVLVGDRERDRAGARADVEHARLLAAREQREAALDHDLGLGPRHERPRGRPSASAAGSPTRRARTASGSRAARRATSRRARASSLGGVEPADRAEHELDARRARARARPAAPRRARRRRRVSSRSPRRARRAASPRDRRHAGADHHERSSRPQAASSARRRSSAWSASVNSSSSPSRIWSSRCTVSLIRWSVSRFSGKL